jgi:hypothetical protein
VATRDVIILAVIILYLVRVIRDVRRGGRMSWDRWILVPLASLWLLGLAGFYVGDWTSSSSFSVVTTTTTTPTP